MTAPVVVGICAAVLSAGSLVVLLPRLRGRGLLDVPVDRSLHEQPTPRGGGLALLVGVVVSSVGAFAVAGLQGDLDTRALGVAAVGLGAVVAMGGLGFADDVSSLPASRRLALQVVIAVAWATASNVLAQRSVVWVVLAAVAMVVLVNITNFVDGANGIIAGQTVVAGLWWSLVAGRTDHLLLSAVAAAVAGAALGFLPFNAPRARVFLGDVGSYGLGAISAVVVVLLVQSRVPTEVVVAPLWPLAVDALATLGRRVYHGDPVWQPHRLHVYQRLVASGWSHAKVSAVFALFTAASCALAVPGLLWADRGLRMLVGLGFAVLGFAYLNLPRMVGHDARWATVRGESSA